MTYSPRERFVGTAVQAALVEMLTSEEAGSLDEAEIVCDGGSCWLGARRISKATVNRLLSLLAVSHDVGGGCDRYTLNEVGRALARDPSCHSSLVEAIASGRPFVFDGGLVTPLDPPSP